MSRVPMLMVRAAQACAYADKPWPLMLCGSPGCGKTCLGLLYTDWVPNSWYWELDDLALRMARAMRGDHEEDGWRVSYDEMRSRLLMADLIVIDELGKCQRDNRATDHQMRVLQMVLDLREDQPLMLLGNFKPSELGRIYDDAIASRLQSGTVLWLDTLPDQRRAKKR